MDSNETPEERFARHCREAEEREQLKQERLAAREEARRAAEEVERASFKVETTTEAITCIDCREVFTAQVMTIGGSKIAQRVCAPCQKVREEDAEQKANEKLINARKEAWLDLCPEDYLDTDVSRIQLELERAGVVCIVAAEGSQIQRITPAQGIQAIKDWPSVGSGLALIGATGIGKTRLMFKLLEGFHFAGQKIAYINAASMSDRIGSLLGESAKAGDEYISRLESVPNLFLDDVGKAKMTDRGEEALYRIVEGRRSRKRRTFFTANCTGAELIQRMSVDRGGPIVRRLRDMTTAIAFTTPKAN